MSAVFLNILFYGYKINVLKSWQVNNILSSTKYLLTERKTQWHHFVLSSNY